MELKLGRSLARLCWKGLKVTRLKRMVVFRLLSRNRAFCLFITKLSLLIKKASNSRRPANCSFTSCNRRVCTLKWLISVNESPSLPWPSTTWLNLWWKSRLARKVPTKKRCRKCLELNIATWDLLKGPKPSCLMKAPKLPTNSSKQNSPNWRSMP